MATIKLTSVSSTVFKVGTKSFLKGDYEIEVNPSNLVFLRPKSFPIGNSVVRQQVPWKTPLPYTAFVDSSSAAYADFETFSLALANLVAGPANASTSDLISDKTTVTQGTSKTTAVVANALNVVITTVALTDAADTGFKFTLTNSKITTASNVMLTGIYAGTQGDVLVTHEGAGSGSVVIRVKNVGTQALNAAMKVGVLVA